MIAVKKCFEFVTPWPCSFASYVLQWRSAQKSRYFFYCCYFSISIAT